MSTGDRILPLRAPFSIEQAPKFFSTSVPRIAQPLRTIAIRYRIQSQAAFHTSGEFSQYLRIGPKRRPPCSRETFYQPRCSHLY